MPPPMAGSTSAQCSASKSSKTAWNSSPANPESASPRFTTACFAFAWQKTAPSARISPGPSLPMAWDGPRIRVWKTMPPDENYYGLGDKPGPLNRRGRAFNNWNSDVFGWGESTDPMYKDIPFFLALRKGAAYGVFFDNTHRSSFDFGKESPDYFSFGAEGGELNYYFFAGPDPKKVVEAYTMLVGRSPLPPLWSLGYQQSRYSYYPEARVREIAT